MIKDFLESVCLVVEIAPTQPAHAQSPPPNQAWVARYDSGGYDTPYSDSLAVDTEGNVYVVGPSQLATTDFATVKYTQCGVGGNTWVSRYNCVANMDDIAQKVVTDCTGNVYVTGWSHNGSTYDITTVKYNASGVQQWAVRDDSGLGDFGHAVVGG